VVRLKRAVAAVAVAGALSIVPSSALAQPVVTGGLVNITIVDVLSGNQVSVQAPITVAANICDVTVAVLAEDLRDGRATCTNETQQITVTRITRR
jgi:hypothetical protein